MKDGFVILWALMTFIAGIVVGGKVIDCSYDSMISTKKAIYVGNKEYRCKEIKNESLNQQNPRNRS